MIKKPAVVNLDASGRHSLFADINGSSLEETNKDMLIEAVEFCDKLTEELKQSKISINKLKEMLLGFKSAQAKKLDQAR